MDAAVQEDLARAAHDDLAREHEELLQFIYVSPIGLLEVAADGTLGMVNPLAMQLLLQIVRANAITNFFTIMESFAPELRNMVDSFSEPAGVVCENHHIHIGPAAETRAEEPKVLSCTLVKLSAARYMASISDISRQIAQQRRLKQAETWFASLLDEVNDFAVVALDTQGVITGVNQSVQRQTGVAPAQALGQRLDIFEVREPGALTPGLDEKLEAARRNGWHLEEAWHKTWGGNRYWCQMLIAVRAGEDGAPESPIVGYTAVLRQVKRHELNTARLRQMLTTDHLTGANNRAHFFEVAERECMRAIRYGQPLALIAMDVDHFKIVNDTHGHAAGDAALKVIAQNCARLLRSVDLFARIGGEEFVVLLPATDLTGAIDLAERLRAVIAAAEIRTQGTVLRCTASFGCAALDMELSTLAGLLASADAALYEAKRAGRNRVVPGTGKLAA